MKELITSKICMTKDIGICGNMFGGNLLAILDEAGAMFSTKLIQSKSIVTLKIEEVLFIHPIKTGDLIEIYGELIKFGNTSVTIKLTVKSINPDLTINNPLYSQEICTTTMVFVKVGKDGKSDHISNSAREEMQIRLDKCLLG